MTAARKLVDPYPYEEQVAPPAIEAPQQSGPRSEDDFLRR